MTSPQKVFPFDVDKPSYHVTHNRDDFLFQPTHRVEFIGFDGHFGLHRPLDVDLDPPRTKWYSGRHKAVYRNDERSASCAAKDKVRLTILDRTGGWQFVLDPVPSRCFGATEHIENETMADKVRILKQVFDLPFVHPNILIHDDACHFESYVRREYPGNSLLFGTSSRTGFIKRTTNAGNQATRGRKRNS